MKEDITPEEVNGHAIDVVFAGVDTVRKLEETSRTFTNDYLSTTATRRPPGGQSIHWLFFKPYSNGPLEGGGGYFLIRG